MKQAYAKIILTSAVVGIAVLMELCYKILDRIGMPED